jgi:large subunit ribosomal protein L18
MPKINQNVSLAEKRKRRVRGKISGTTERPRITVFRSNKNTYLQVINDESGKTLASSNNLSILKAGSKLAGTKMEKAVLITQDLIKQIKNLKIKALKFDRGS